jgi:hypothetical protein
MASVISSGVTEIEVMLGAVTVTDVDPATEPKVAVIVEEPAATPLTKPAALTVAFAIVEEVQVTRSVTSQVLASLFVPLATSCSVVLTGTVGLAGVTAIENGVAHTLALVTVIWIEAENVPDRAMTVVTPVAAPVTTPAALTDAVVESDELQVTEDVRSLLVPSEKLPVACKDCVFETMIVAEVGLTARPVSEAEPDWPPPPLHPASKRPSERIQILCRTSFLRAKGIAPLRGNLLFGAYAKPMGCHQTGTVAERVALFLSVRNPRKCANLKKVQAFQCDTF